MKKRKSVRILILLSLLLLIFNSCTTAKDKVQPPSAERLSLEVLEECPLVMRGEIVQTGAKQKHLYYIAEDWIRSVLVNTEEDIIYRDPDEGVIACLAEISQDIEGYQYNFEYKFTVEAVDGRTMVTIVCSYGIGRKESFSRLMIVSEPHLLPPDDYRALKEQFRRIADEFAASL